MTEPFCRTCVETLLGRAAIEKARRIVEGAPPFTPEQAENLRAIFASARAIRGSEEPSPKPCGHDG